MAFDDMPVAGILNMMRLRGWELVTPIALGRREEGLVLTTDRKCLLPGLGAFETVTVYPGVTPFFKKYHSVAGVRFCWVDRKARLLISKYETTKKTTNTHIQLFDLCDGLDYIDEHLGTPADFNRLKAYRELAKPKPA